MAHLSFSLLHISVNKIRLDFDSDVTKERSFSPRFFFFFFQASRFIFKFNQIKRNLKSDVMNINRKSRYKTWTTTMSKSNPTITRMTIINALITYSEDGRSIELSFINSDCGAPSGAYVPRCVTCKSLFKCPIIRLIIYNSNNNLDQT